MNSIEKRFSKNVFEAVQKTRSTCFIGSKTTRLRLVVLNPIKHSCSFFKHDLTNTHILNFFKQVQWQHSILRTVPTNTEVFLCGL